MSHSNYMAGVASMTGITDAPMTSDDKDAINKALGLVDDALNEAQHIKDSNSSVWSKLKASLTDAQLSAANYQVDTFFKAAQVAHDKADKLLSGSATTHAQVVDFINYCAQISDLTVLKDSSNRNDLLNLAKEVGKETAKEIVNKTETLVTSVSKGLWDMLPWYGKVAVPVGGLGILYVGFRRVAD